MLLLFENFDYYHWLILPALIFLARLSDVTLATLRHIFISRGLKNIVPFVAFVEVILWLIAVTQITKEISNPVCYLAFALGYASGTYVGILLDERLAIGMQVIRVITNHDHEVLVNALRKHNHGVTVIQATGAIGPVLILFSVVKRQNVEHVISLVREHQPEAFYSIEDVKTSSMGVFSDSERSVFKRMFGK